MSWLILPHTQSLSHTRATLPVWYTSSQIESTVLSSCFWCNRTFSLPGTCPLFISSNKVLRARRHRHRLPKFIRRFRGQRGHSSAWPPAEAVTIKVCVLQAERNWQQPWVSLHITLHDTKLTIVGANYMTQWREQGCHFVRVLCQINKRLRLMALPPPPFFLLTN